jgi:xylulokinase
LRLAERSVAGDLVIAADFGTSGVKVGLVDPDMRIVASTVVSYPLSLPAPSRAEQNPRDWWEALAGAVYELSHRVERLAERAAGLVFCAQMCGVVAVDGAGQPLRPAIIWLDKRAAGLTRELVGGLPSFQGYRLDRLARWLWLANGAPSLNGMDPPGKMAWIARHEPDVFARTERLLDVGGWLVHRATGTICCTADSANVTWMMDTRRGRESWSPALAAMLGLSLDRLPPIVPGTAPAGTLTAGAAAELGLPAGLPVIAGSGDVAATAIGSGAVADGALHICLGTSSWVGGFFDRRVINPFAAYATIVSSVENRPLLIATQENAGAAYGWLARLLLDGRDDDPAAMAALAAGAGGPEPDDPFFLPWLSGERVPVDDDRLRGAFHGLSLRHDRRAVTRAVLEGIALNTRWAWSKVVKEKGVRHDGPVPLVGGAAANPVLARMMADAIGRPVATGETRLAGVLGAAAIAAPALGWSSSVWDAARRGAGTPATVHQPDPRRAEKLDARDRALKPIRKALIGLYRKQRNLEHGAER